MQPIQIRRESINLTLRKEKLFKMIMEKRLGSSLEHNFLDQEINIKQEKSLFIGIPHNTAIIPSEDLEIFNLKVC